MTNTWICQIQIDFQVLARGFRVRRVPADQCHRDRSPGPAGRPWQTFRNRRLYSDSTARARLIRGPGGQTGYTVCTGSGLVRACRRPGPGTPIVMIGFGHPEPQEVPGSGAEYIIGGACQNLNFSVTSALTVPAPRRPGRGGQPGWQC
jgi:hypothetical protein